MAWMTATIFIKDASEDTLLVQLERLLATPELARDHGGVADPPPLVRLSPSLEGWRAISGLRGWLTDLPGAAQALSKQGTTVSCEIHGSSLRLRLGQFVSGQRRHLLCSPTQLDWASLAEHRGAMPLYEDVEEKAFKTLCALGIPGALLGIGLAPLGEHDTVVLSGGVELVPPASAAAAWERRPVDLPSVSLEQTAPVLPRQSSRDFGIALFDERYVEGHPSAAAVERLLALEERWAQRARRACGVETLNLTLTYLGGTFQEELDEQLRQRGRHVTPTPRRTTPPWWAFWRYFGASGLRGRR